MRFHSGAVPTSSDFKIDEGWTALREPEAWEMQLYSVPFAILNFLVLGLPWFLFKSIDEPVMRSLLFRWSTWVFLLSLLGIHEVCHLLVHPRAGFSGRSIFGVWPSRLMLYAHYDGEIKKMRLVAILLTPLFALSATPLIGASFLPVEIIPLVAFLSIANALFSSGDVYSAVLILWQVPPWAVVRNQGWNTFWKVR